MKLETKNAILAELKAARDIADVAEAADRDLTAEERTKAFAHIEMAKTLKQRSADSSDFAKQLGELSDGIGLDEPATGDKPEPGQYNRLGGKSGKAAHSSLGDAFVKSNEFQALTKSVPNGRFGDNARVQSQPFGVKDLLTGVNRTTSAGALLTPQQLGLQDPFYQRPLTIRDLVTAGRTETDVIEGVRLLSVTNNAAPVAEATSAGPISATGTIVTPVQAGLKPESGMVFEKFTTNVKTIATWIPATKRALSDASQIRTLVDAFLLYALDEELEDQIVSGNGVGENFQGVSGTSGIQTQAADTDYFVTTRKARTKVRLGGRAIPTAYVMHPIDWQNIDLMRDGEERFYGAGPFAMSNPYLWGLPVVESEAIPQGTAYVADWKKAVLWDREQASIQVTDSHADFFIRNLVAILAELRAAFAVLRPAAFVKITL